MPSSVKMLRRLLARVSANSLRSNSAPTRTAMLAFSTDPAYGFVFMRSTFAPAAISQPAGLHVKRRHRSHGRSAIGAEAGSASIVQVREALSEGLLFSRMNPNKRPEFAEAPAIGGGALTTERRANGQALCQALTESLPVACTIWYCSKENT